jgi:hypothetical protein
MYGNDRQVKVASNEYTLCHTHTQGYPYPFTKAYTPATGRCRGKTDKSRWHQISTHFVTHIHKDTRANSLKRILQQGDVGTRPTSQGGIESVLRWPLFTLPHVPARLGRHGRQGARGL